MSLSDAKIRSIKPSDKPFKLTDSQDLYLLVNPVQQRIAEKTAASAEKCFEAVALAWHKTNKKRSVDYAERILASMRNHIFPAISHRLSRR